MKGRNKIAILSLIMLTIFVMALTTVSAQTTEDPSADGTLGMICLIYLCAMFVPLIIWLVITVIVYNDATKIGADTPWLWGLLVFLTGVIGLIIYLVVIRPKAVEQQRMGMGGAPYQGESYSRSSDMPRKDGTCPHCGKYTGASVGRCTYCGSNL